MKISKFAKILFLSILFATTSFSQFYIPGFDADYISVNNVRMWVDNYGEGSHNPYTYGPGFYWPYPSDTVKTLIYSDGLFWMGKIDNAFYSSGNFRYIGVIPGTVDSDIPSQATKNKFRVYKVRPGWDKLPASPRRDELEKDFKEWPADIGAPYFDLNNDGKYNPEFDKPQIYGDEMLWYVFHDGVPIMGGLFTANIEVQVTVYAFRRDNLLKDVIFKKYKIINKGISLIDSMFFSYYSDPEVGDPSDDYVGCDSSLSLTYSYNSIASDWFYGSPPPAVGYALLQGPIAESIGDSAFYNNRIIKNYKNLKQTSFTFFTEVYLDGHYLWPFFTAHNYWNFVRGLDSTGIHYIDPHSNKPTKFPLNGDPYRQTGWYEGEGWEGTPPSWRNRRMLLNSGPFTMAPGDTQEVVYAIFAGQGLSNTASVEELKKMVPRLQYFHKNYSPLVPEIKEEKKQLDFKMTQNYPNPFNSQTAIHYQIPLESRVIIKVYDVLGNEVALLKNELQKPGDYQTVFNANNLASGIYILNISAREFFSSRKMILLR